MTNEIKILEAYQIANRYSNSLIRKYNVKENVMTAEDLVADFIVNFLEKDFVSKFEEARTSFRHYVWVGLRNILVSRLRKENSKPYFVAETQLSESGDEVSIFDLIPDKACSVDKFFSSMLIEEILAKVEETPFGYGKVVEVGTEKFNSTLKSLVTLFAQGYTKIELSEMFGVTAARIGQLLNQAVSPLMGVLATAR